MVFVFFEFGIRYFVVSFICLKIVSRIFYFSVLGSGRVVGLGRGFLFVEGLGGCCLWCRSY